MPERIVCVWMTVSSCRMPGWSLQLTKWEIVGLISLAQPKFHLFKSKILHISPSLSWIKKSLSNPYAFTRLHVVFVLVRASGHSLPPCHDKLQFKCGDGSCVPRLKVCDGPEHCVDGSDEQNCGQRPSRDLTSSQQSKLSLFTVLTFSPAWDTHLFTF